MLKKKIKLYYKKCIREFFKVIYGKVLLPKKNTKLPIKISVLKNSKFKTFSGKKYKLYSINKARIYTDNNENGVYDEGIDELGDQTTGDLVVYNGQTTDVDFLSGVFQSFSDAPGGFSEELKEFTWALGAEYVCTMILLL